MGERFFSVPKHSDRLWAPAILLFSGFWGLFSQETKQPEHEADNRPMSSTKVMNDWSCTFTPPMCLYGMYVYRFIHFTCITVTVIIAADVIDWLVCVEGMQGIFCAIAARSINVDKLKAS